MPILTQCPYCQKKFRAPDTLAGKPVKCPGCRKAVRVPQLKNRPARSDSAQGSKEVSPKSTPASSAEPNFVSKPGKQPGWYILSENGEQLGPVSKEQLDNLATKGRLSFCKVRRQDSLKWKWADDVYPDLPVSKAKDESSKSVSTSDEQESARLVTCPDCGNTVSRRATRCPHCGCPAAVLMAPAASGLQDRSVSPSAPAPPPVPDAAREAALDAALDGVYSPKSGSWRLYAIIGGVALLLAVVAAPLCYVWWTFNRQTEQVAEQLGLTASEPEPLPEPEQPSEELLSADGKRECIDEAAGKMARHIDEFQRQNHVPLAMIGQTMESVKMLEALAGGDLDAIPDSTSSIPGGGGVKPYKSQLNDLFIECRDWVRDNVKKGPCTTNDVWQTAQQWAAEKQEAILEPLGGVLPTQGLLAPPPTQTP